MMKSIARAIQLSAFALSIFLTAPTFAATDGRAALGRLSCSLLVETDDASEQQVGREHSRLFDDTWSSLELQWRSPHPEISKVRFSFLRFDSYRQLLQSDIGGNQASATLKTIVADQASRKAPLEPELLLALLESKIQHPSTSQRFQEIFDSDDWRTRKEANKIIASMKLISKTASVSEDAYRELINDFYLMMHPELNDVLWNFKQGRNSIKEAIRLRVESAFLQHDVLNALRDLGFGPKETSGSKAKRFFQTLFAQRSLAVLLALDVWSYAQGGIFVPPHSLGFSQSQIPLQGVSRQAIVDPLVAADQAKTRFKIWASLDQLTQSAFRVSMLSMVAIGSYVLASWGPLAISDAVESLRYQYSQPEPQQQSPARETRANEPENSPAKSAQTDVILANYRKYLELTTLVPEKNTSTFVRRQYSKKEIDLLVEDMRLRLQAQQDAK